MSSADQQKAASGVAAAALVRDGMKVGLGTGSTAAHFVRALAKRAKSDGLDLICVPTSEATATLASSLGLKLSTLDELGRLDMTVDGADEIGPRLALIKGGGAALLREKLVWEASDRCVVIADAAKVVPVLGTFLLPVEVVAFGHTTTARRIEAVVRNLGIDAAPQLRVRDGTTVATDSGQLIYDINCMAIVDPQGLANALKQVTGVIEHGLFLGLATEALVGTDTGVDHLTA
jgi:ribose 5-phosphate isomerase A